MRSGSRRGPAAGRGSCSSTRSTPGSAVAPPGPWRTSCAALADGAQLLVITHLPQIARAADAHFVVEKPDDAGAATVVRLGEAEVVEELARMLGGDPDDEAALKHAEALRS